MDEYKVELCKKKGIGKKWYWRLKASNGKILAHSENYNRKGSAKGIAEQLSADLWGCEYEEV